jgi:hypothetical protein
MSREDVEYYRSRAAQERQLAAEATSPEAAKAHEELARSYEILVKRAEYLPTTHGPIANQSDEPTSPAT